MIDANISTRVALRMGGKTNYRAVLGEEAPISWDMMASHPRGHGYLAGHGGNLIRFDAADSEDLQDQDVA
ncbi:hypothetical protein ABT282_07020 [Streptomyces sp. NPDC000927]|uniref:hypothetical protein n=1 Tax=Streptomyces sp. NPDC000927 TaxID=3154371 RepID=UPI0033270FB7